MSGADWWVRRGHWDDELLSTVMQAINDLNGRLVRPRDTYTIIAAVEDWQVQHPKPCVEADTDSLHRAEAAIQRVRELHKGSPECAYCVGATDDHTTPHHDHRLIETCDECAEAMPCSTIRALDGTA